MDDYIGRAEAIKAVVDAVDNGLATTSDDLAEVLTGLPAAEVEPLVHAHWIRTGPYTAIDRSHKKMQECSHCRAAFVSDGNAPWSNHPYCCECGAKMDEKEDKDHV